MQAIQDSIKKVEEAILDSIQTYNQSLPNKPTISDTTIISSDTTIIDIPIKIEAVEDSNAVEVEKKTLPKK